MRALVPAAVAAALALSAPPAHAYRANVGIAQWAGFANPGIGTVPTATLLGIQGQLTLYGAYGNLVAGGSDVGTVVNCVLNAAGTESTAAGFGNLAGQCGHVLFQSCVYVRVLMVFTAVCANGTTAELVFTPQDVNPTFRFTLTGTVTYAVAP